MTNFSLVTMRKYLLFACVFILVTVEIFQLDFNFVADKFSHLKASLLLFTLIFAARLTFRRHASEAIALVLALRDTLLIGILKELLDGVFGIGVVEFADLTADMFGIVIPFLGILLAEFFGVGYESFIHAESDKVFDNEKSYFKKQLNFLRRAGLKLIYQI